MTVVKICGITNLDEARIAVEAGADLVGFIFYPRSPRFVTPERAREIVLGLRGHTCETRFVGVFVNNPSSHIRAVVDSCGLDYVQLHGEESPEMMLTFTPNVFKSLRPRDEAHARSQVETYRPFVNGNRPAFIVDAFNPTLFGGTGKRADWTIARRLAGQFPILLAGGLGPDSVVEAIQAVRPWGVDVSTGVERAPGLKDSAKVREFIARAHSSKIDPLYDDRRSA